MRGTGLDEVDRIIIDIASDNKSGSTDILKRCVNAVQTFTEGYHGKPDEFLRELLAVCRKLLEAQPAMAPVFNCVNDVLCTVEGMAKNLMREFTLQWCEAYMRELEKAREWVVEEGVGLIEDAGAVATISYSSTVLDILTQGGREYQVMISEGRPMNEGSRAAELLADHGISTTLVVDAALPYLVENADLVLVGADTVNQSHVYNKTGTFALLMASLHYDVPFYVVAERNKFAPKEHFTPRIVEHPGYEVAYVKHEHLHIKNIYFDRIPVDQVTGVVTDLGIMKPHDVRKIVQDRKISSMLVR